MSRQYSKQELCDAVYRAVLNAKKPSSRRDISETIGLVKSGHVINMINHLVAENWLISTLGRDKSGRPTYFYTIGQLANTPDCEGIAQIGIDTSA